MDDNKVFEGAGRERQAGDQTTEGANDRRLQRIGEYLADSLKKPDALAASLGAVNSDLLLIAYRFKRAIESAWPGGPDMPDLDELDLLMPVIDQLLRITRQIDRFAHLSGRLGISGEAETKQT